MVYGMLTNTGRQALLLMGLIVTHLCQIYLSRVMWKIEVIRCSEPNFQSCSHKNYLARAFLCFEQATVNHRSTSINESDGRHNLRASVYRGGPALEGNGGFNNRASVNRG